MRAKSAVVRIDPSSDTDSYASIRQPTNNLTLSVNLSFPHNLSPRRPTVTIFLGSADLDPEERRKVRSKPASEMHQKCSGVGETTLIILREPTTASGQKRLNFSLLGGSRFLPVCHIYVVWRDNQKFSLGVIQSYRLWMGFHINIGLF